METAVEHTGPQVVLEPLTPAALTRIEPWFEHPQLQRWLADRSWIRRELRLIDQRPGSEFRGMRVLRSYGWIAVDRAGSPAAFIGGDVYDRWAEYHGEGPDGALTGCADPRISMALVYAVDPARWREGYGRAALTAVLAHGALADVEVFYCGIDAENRPSRHCAHGAGFRPVRDAPDTEGMIYYRRQRAPHRP